MHIYPDRVLDNYANLYSSQPVADRLDRIEFSLKNPDQVSIYVNPDGTETYMYKKRILDPLADKFRVVDGVLKPLKLIGDLWTDISYTGIDKEGGVKLVGGKKPEKLIERLIETISIKGDIILDFHLGSGTTCAVAHKIGRQYIGIEQLDYGDNGSVERLRNVIGKTLKAKGKLIDNLEFDTSGISKAVNWKGGGSFVYCELLKWNEVFVEKIEKAKTKEQLLKVWEEIKDKGHLSYRLDIQAFEENAKDFGQLSLENQKRFLLETLDKNQLYVNFSEIDDEDYGVSKEDKKINKEFYKD